MALQTKKRVLHLLPRQKGFTKRFIKNNTKKKELEDLRKLFTKEKIKILYTIKNKKPSSIYELSKILNKDFKSVYENVKFLKDSGIISLKKIKNGKRESLQPIIIVDKINLMINI